ncbi:hypothetical protein BBJ29_000372 [Phytophthora kernoviae]|uniref:Uncharacterized protein n=1 Tax=Phytophthora kernoviae TaxID=325452 RepID=A0A3F2RZW9_9STRA|nr:hypothetical protein BBJ29_000372 [Phytophthora kernoviae]RLN67484.1 hypothetical protein BBP00_00001566 [Phytophthora kernoviae]
MDTLHAQKENVDTNVHSSGISTKMRLGGPDKFTTPKRGFVIHEDSKSGKKELKENSTKKRRVLGDISNKQQSHHSGSGSNDTPSVKKSGLGKSGGHSKKLKGLSEKKTTKTPLKLKTVHKTPLKSKSVMEVPKVEEVPDIEFAYGGLSSSKTDPAYLAGLHDELVRDLVNDKIPTLFDDFDPADSFTGWDDDREIAMLESGEPPSPWWSLSDLKSTKGLKEDIVKEEKQEQEENFGDDVPPPDELPDDPSNDFNDDGLLDDLLSVDVEAACTE